MILRSNQFLISSSKNQFLQKQPTKQLLRKIFKNLTGKINSTKKKTPFQLASCGFYENFENSFFIKHLRSIGFVSNELSAFGLNTENYRVNLKVFSPNGGK